LPAWASEAPLTTAISGTATMVVACAVVQLCCALIVPAAYGGMSKLQV
jgi:hypothetical protein